MLFRGEIMYFKRIGDLRSDQDMNQQVLADYLGVSQGTYSGYESGRINITAEAFVRLADFYHVSLDYLAGRSNDKTIHGAPGPSRGR